MVMVIGNDDDFVLVRGKTKKHAQDLNIDEEGFVYTCMENTRKLATLVMMM